MWETHRYETGACWHQPPAYDMNPTPFRKDMALSLDGVNTASNMDTVIQTAAYYDVENPENQAVHMTHIMQSHYRELAADTAYQKKKSMLWRKCLHMVRSRTIE